MARRSRMFRDSTSCTSMSAVSAVLFQDGKGFAYIIRPLH